MESPFRTVFSLPGSEGGLSADAAVNLVVQRCRDAHAKHGELPADLFAQHAILAEEMGEVAKALNEHAYSGATLEQVIEELTDVAATALCTIEQLTRTNS